jgi:hypothetical protein
MVPEELARNLRGLAKMAIRQCVRMILETMTRERLGNRAIGTSLKPKKS